LKLNATEASLVECVTGGMRVTWPLWLSGAQGRAC